MRKIYVLDENHELKPIDAGATSYTELSEQPIAAKTLNTTVTIDPEKNVVLTPSDGHKWTEEELNDFCGIAHNEGTENDGKFDYGVKILEGCFDIETEKRGHEFLIIDTVQVDQNTVRQCRRITSQYDWVYSEQAKAWVSISDTSAGALIFSWEKPQPNITKGTTVVLKYNYYSATGKIGTVQCLVNNNLKVTTSVESSSATNELDITEFLSTGDNTVLLKVTSGDAKSELFAHINVIDLRLTSSFTEHELYEGNTLKYIYSLSGSVEKTVYFRFDENEPTSRVYTASSNATNVPENLDTSMLSHGIHKLTVWAEAIVGASIIKTPELVYNVPLWKNNSLGSIIAIHSYPTQLEQGATAIVEYTIYHNTKTSVPVTLSFPEEFKMDPVVMNVPVKATQNWSFTTPAGKEYLGKFTFKISSENAEESFIIDIIQGENIDFERDNLLYDLKLVGTSNNLVDRDQIKYTTIVSKGDGVPAVAEMKNFNFVNDGWLNSEEEDNRNMLRVNSTSKVIYPDMNLLTLLDSGNSVGCTFDIDFLGRNTTNANRVLVSLATDEQAKGGEGIFIKEQSVDVNIAGSIYRVEYKSGERTRVLVTIGPDLEKKRIITIYINGVLSYVSQYAANPGFGNKKTKLVINPNYGFLDVYGLRIYGASLNLRQVLRNYIASFNTSAERVAEREFNDIYVEGTDDISFDKVKKSMPTFVFTTNLFKNQKQEMPTKKKDKKYGPVNYLDPVYGLDFDEAFKESKKKPVADVQGTSSQKYPRKNFKIKMNSKHSMNPAVVGEKVFTFKKDFMDSSHANNTGLAKLVQTLYTNPVPPQISYIQYTTGELDEENETIYKDVYDASNGRKVDYAYIQERAGEFGDTFSSLLDMNIEVKLLTEPHDTGDKYFLQYNIVNNPSTHTFCEIKTEPGEVVKEVKIKDKSYIRTTVYGQPCAFFWEATDETGQTLPPVYQGVYNFNTDKVATENMELEEEGCLSFEFANNVGDGAVFKSCENFTEVHNSFEFRAYQKNGVPVEIWEDYYDDAENQEKYSSGGYDADEELEIPVLNALYNINLSAYTSVEETLNKIAGPDFEGYCKEHGYTMPPKELDTIACRLMGVGYDREIQWRNIGPTEQHITWYTMCSVQDLINSLDSLIKETLKLEDIYAEVQDGIIKWAYVTKRTQLFIKKGSIETPINYTYLSKNIYESGEIGSDTNPPKGGFYKEDAGKIEAQYQYTPEGKLQVSHVNSTALSDQMKIAETIAQFEINNGMAPDEYYDYDAEKNPSGLEKAPEENKDDPTPLVLEVINQDADFLVRWGYDTKGGDTDKWHNYCHVSDLISTLPKETQAIVNDNDVKVQLKKGTTRTAVWYYSYPVQVKWLDLVKAGESISDNQGQPVEITKLEKVDMFEIMHRPVFDVVNWVVDCFKDYQATGSVVKFTSEIDKHVNLDYTLTYYVMALFAGAADSLAKNMFWNSYDGGKIWYPVWYDIDTCFGLSNDGHPNFPYSLEIYGDGSKLGTADIYNGAKSNFWKLVHAAYPQEIDTRYKMLREQRLTYESVMKVLYGEQISKIAPVHFNEDAKFSYLPYPAYYYTAQGSRYERLKYWVESRFAYLDSKFENKNYVDDSYELRTNAGLPIEVTTDMDIYVGNKFGQHVEKMAKKRCLANHTVSFDPRDYNIKNMNDLETLIYGASHITSLGDLADHQITSIKFPTKTESVLENLAIGKEEVGFTNTNFTTLTIGRNSVLKTLNVSNCINLGKESATLDLTGCPSIQTVLAKNTLLTNIMIPDGSPVISMHLPTVRSLRLVNQIMLEDLTVDSFEKLSSLTWDNVPLSPIKVEDILNECYTQSNNNMLKVIRVIGINNEKAFDSAWMDWLLARSGTNDIGGSVDIPYITGNLKVQGLDKNVLIPYVKTINSILADNFCYVTTYDKETKETKHWKLVVGSELDSFEEIIDENELEQYKLNLVLEQIVADENIFGVSGEGR